MLPICSWQKVRYQGTTGCLQGSLILSPVCPFPCTFLLPTAPERSSPPVLSTRLPAMRGGTFPFKDVPFFPRNPAADRLWRHPTCSSLADDFFSRRPGLLTSDCGVIICLITAGVIAFARPCCTSSLRRESAPAYLFQLRRNSLPVWLPLTLELLFCAGTLQTRSAAEGRNGEFPTGCDRFLRPTCHNVVTFVWLCSTNCICH